MPIKFSEDSNQSDFKMGVSAASSIYGCTLARAFFSGIGKEALVLYPEMFEQSEKEQVDTMLHEIGYVFGLRHFFADVSEQACYPHIIIMQSQQVFSTLVSLQYLSQQAILLNVKCDCNCKSGHTINIQ